MPIAKAPASFTLTNANTSYLVVPPNNTRTTVAIANMHTSAIVYLGIGYNAEIGKGFPIYPGSAYHMDVLDNSPQAINAISDVAGVNLSIQEIG